MALSKKVTYAVSFLAVPMLVTTLAPNAVAEVIDLTNGASAAHGVYAGEIIDPNGTPDNNTYGPGNNYGNQSNSGHSNNNNPNIPANPGPGTNNNPGHGGTAFAPSYPGGIRPKPVEGLQPAFEGSPGPIGVDQIKNMSPANLNPTDRIAAVAVAGIDLIQQGLGSPRTHIGPEDIAGIVGIIQAASSANPALIAVAIQKAGPAVRNIIAEAKQFPAYGNALIHAPSTLADNAGVTSLLNQMQASANSIDTSGFEDALGGLASFGGGGTTPPTAGEPAEGDPAPGVLPQMPGLPIPGN